MNDFDFNRQDFIPINLQNIFTVDFTNKYYLHIDLILECFYKEILEICIY